MVKKINITTRSDKTNFLFCLLLLLFINEKPPGSQLDNLINTQGVQYLLVLQLIEGKLLSLRRLRNVNLLDSNRLLHQDSQKQNEWEQKFFLF